MTETEYFGNWIKVIDMDKLKKTIGIIYGISRHTEICPEYSNIFRAFHACPYNDLKVVILGQDFCKQL